MAGRVMATFSVVMVLAIAFGSCAWRQDLSRPLLPCTDGGRAGDDGVVVFDVQLRQLVLGPASVRNCEGRAIRTNGYLCFSDQYGPVLFESREVAEADAWIMEGLSWWQPYSITFPIPTERMRGLQVPDWDDGPRMNGHLVTVVGMFHEQRGPWPDMSVTDDSAPARGIFFAPFYMQFATARDAIVPSTPPKACPGPVERVYLPLAPPRSVTR